MSSRDVVHAFIRAVNDHDIDRIVALMTPDHLFTDSLGNEIPGRRAMRDAWLGYLEMIPDYRIEPAEDMEEGDRVVVMGNATGTYSRDGCLDPRDRFRISAAWRATVRDGRIHRWRVYADNGPLREVMQR